MSILKLPHAVPRVLLFDWHATLVDTHDAMYYAVNDVLPKLEELGLMGRIISPEDSKTIDDAKLVIYIQQYLKLHPKVVEARKISRTDIFEILFGADEEAKHIAHREFHQAYRNHYGQVTPFEDHLEDVLEQLKDMSLVLGVLTNRDREFMEHEIDSVGESGWRHLFDTMVCGDDVDIRKPAPDSIYQALHNLGVKPGPGTWYIGDSTTDTIAAKRAGVTNVFYNGAGWDQTWLDKIFPDTIRHPYKPDAVVNGSMELLEMVRKFVRTGPGQRS
jgi:phosphoglycolate phosphatase